MSVCFCCVIPLIFDGTGHEQAGNIRSETPLMRPLAGPTKGGSNTELVLTAKPNFNRKKMLKDRTYVVLSADWS